MTWDELPSVTVVVPAYNAGRTIAECVGSLLALDYPPDRLELIVVDNASSDDTRRVLQQFAGSVQVLAELVRGSAAARNRGIRAAGGDIVAMTDADCVVARGWLRALVPALADEGVGAVGGRVAAWVPRNRIARYGERIHDHDQAINLQPALSDGRQLRFAAGGVAGGGPVRRFFPAPAGRRSLLSHSVG